MKGALRVHELIAELQKRDPESVVQTWDAYHDSETDEVYVSDMRGGATLICSVNFGASTALLNTAKKKENQTP